MCSADNGWASFTPDSTVITGANGTVVTVVEVDSGNHAIASGTVTLLETYRSKNILRYGPYSDGDRTVSIADDGKISMSFKNPSNGIKWNLGMLKAGTYTLSKSNTPRASGIFAIVKNASNTELASLNLDNDQNAKKSFTLGSDSECVFIIQNWSTNNSASGYLQLEAGDMNTSWVKPDVTDSNGVGI